VISDIPVDSGGSSDACRSSSSRASRPPESLCLPPVEAPAGWLEQILENLLSNAKSTVAPDTPIEVETRRREEYVEVLVLDRGRGIAAEDAHRLFEPFFRIRPGAPDTLTFPRLSALQARPP